MGVGGESGREQAESGQAAVGGWRARGETSVSGGSESQSLNLGVWAGPGSQAARGSSFHRPGLHAGAGLSSVAKPQLILLLAPGPLPITTEAQWAVFPRQGGMDPCYGASLLLVKRLVPWPA